MASPMIDLSGALRDLRETRPIFHSEADFQFALAWRLQHLLPDAAVRLEYKPAYLDRRGYLDLWVRHGGQSAAIELKYWTRRLQLNVGGESSDLLTQGAQDIARYDFLKDVGRIESVVGRLIDCDGYAVALTKGDSFWKQPAALRPTIDAAFRIHEGQELGGELGWADHAGAGTTRGREKAVNVHSPFVSEWRDYSHVTASTGGIFRYLMVHVPAGSIPFEDDPPIEPPSISGGVL